MQIVDGVYKFDTGPFNWYIIEEAGRLTVVDAGFPGHFRTLVKGLRTIGKSVRDVEAILITHAHADHTGFAERLRKASGAPVFIHSADKTSVQRILQLPWTALIGNAWRTHVRGMLEHATFHGVFRMARVKTVATFEDNEILDVPGRPQVIHTPGHTAGHVAFYLSEKNVLFSGDSLLTQNMFTGAHGHPQFAPHSLNADNLVSTRSIDRFREIGDVTLLSGHGKPWSGSMSEAIQLARKSLGVNNR